VVGVKGVYRSNQTELVARFVQLEYQYKYERMSRMPQVDFIDTYSAAYRRSVFLQNGGFDVTFTVPSVEDQELSFRLAQKGYRLEFNPQAAVYHLHDRNLSEYRKRKFGIGYWKAYMLRWLPQKTFSDSHTSPSQRWQIVFLGMAAFALLLSVVYPKLLWAAAIAAALFFLSGFQFIYFVLRHDLLAGLASPLMLIVRAAVLGAGLVSGFVMPPRTQQRVQPSLSMGKFFMKRTIDIVGSAVGLVISAPVMLIAGIVIRLDSRGPAFFVQERAGENSKPFRVYKLRTMYNGAEERVDEVLALNTLEGPVYKIPNDPRVTRVGRVLRRWSIDELPQFWNVLKGDMSLVGPRPEELWVVEKYTDEQRKRLAFKPGLTGPMQVNGRGNLNFKDRFELELEYMQNYSPVKDLEILLRSISAIISGKGAY
jgi:lipopolysaccharide/colanic/teichoic acid biosynthesis glycosyltransferase